MSSSSSSEKNALKRKYAENVSEKKKASTSDSDSCIKKPKNKIFFNTELNRTAFRDAVLSSKYDTVKEMLQNGFDVDRVLNDDRKKKIESCIFTHIEEGSHKIDNALHMAATRGDFDMVKLLLDNGADVAYPNKYGNNALHLACEKDLLEIAKLLVKRNRTVINMADYCGWTPFHVGCSRGSPELIEYLVEEGADVGRTHFISSPLYSLLIYNRKCTPNIVRLLVDHGAELSVQGRTLLHEGKTALHYMIEEYYCKEEFRDALLYVMERSDLSARNNEGANLFIYTLFVRDLDLLKMFLNVGMPEDALSRKLFYCVDFLRWKRIDSNSFIQLNIEAIDLLLDSGVSSSKLLDFYPNSEDISRLRQKFDENRFFAPEWDINDLSVLRERVEQRRLEVRTLKSFCRDVVRGCTRKDRVTELGLPQSIVRYLLFCD